MLLKFLLRKSLKMVIRFELIHKGVYNIYSDFYIRSKKVLKKHLFAERDLFLAQICVRILLEMDPGFDVLSEVTGRVDKYTGRLALDSRLLVVDSVLQKLFYYDLNLIGNADQASSCSTCFR